MKPYIFLSQNYLSQAQDGNGDSLDIRTVENQQVPFEQTLFFADRYGNIVNREIDTLIISGTNIVNMTVEKADGLGNYSTCFEVQGNDKDSLIIKLETPVTTSSLRFTVADDTYNPQIINIGYMGVFKYLCNLCALTDGSFKNEANYGSYRLVSGALVHYADYKKWSCKLKMENLPQEQFNILANQARDVGEITVIPYQDLEAEELYECGVNREISYEVDRKTELFSLDLELNEL